MNCNFLVICFLTFPFYFAIQLSHGRDSYEIQVTAVSSTNGFTSIHCVSKQKDAGQELLVTGVLSNRVSLQWSIQEGEHDHDTMQTCSLNDQDTNKRFDLKLFDGSWIHNEILWETHTYADFIYKEKSEKLYYNWMVKEDIGAFLFNGKTGEYELVIPTRDVDIDRVFIINLSEDESPISLICLSNEDDNRLADKTKLAYNDAVGWIIKTSDRREGTEHNCYVGWKNKKTGNTQHTNFDAFKSSWRQNEIVVESYTLHDFIFNPNSRNLNFIWRVDEVGISLYNFKAKAYCVLTHFEN